MNRDPSGRPPWSSPPFQHFIRARATSARNAVRYGALALCLLTQASCVRYEARPLVPENELGMLRSRTLNGLHVEYAAPHSDQAATTHIFDPSDGVDESELAAVALTLNPSLRAKRLAIGEAQALLVNAGVLPNPDLAAFVRPGVGGSSGTALGFDALFGLLRLGERDAARSLAQSRVDLTHADVLAAELRTVSDVRLARIRLLAAQASARLHEEELALRNDALALVRRQRELGEATEISLALVELDATGVDRQLRDARATVESEGRSLHALLGVPSTLELDLTQSETELTFTIVPDPSDDELDARLLAGLGELHAHASEYASAEEELRLAVARQGPRFGIGLSYEKDVDGSEGLGLGASIEVPLFDRNQGEIAEKHAQRERERAEYIAALHLHRARAIEARAQMRRARADVERQEREVMPLIRRTESLFEAALRARELSAFEWLNARTRAIQSRRDALDALTRYATASVELDAATGTPLVMVLTETSGAASQR